MSAARTPTGETYQAPGIGPVRTLTVGTTWTDLHAGVPEADLLRFDLAVIRVPAGSKRVLLLQSVDDLTGETAQEDDEPTSWTLDPGVHVYAVNRSSGDGRFFLAVDPMDTGAGTSPVAVKIMRAG